MPEAEAKKLKELINYSDNILEDGAGGSTAYAVSQGKKITTIETDKDYLNNLLDYLNHSDLVDPIYVNVGVTKGWGYAEAIPDDFNTVRQYAKPAWKKDSYDLVIIDGRFRAVAFMISWNNAELGTKFFWDDFTGREHYHKILKYVFPDRKVGRAVIFTKTDDIKFDDKFIHKFVSDQR